MLLNRCGSLLPRTLIQRRSHLHLIRKLHLPLLHPPLLIYLKALSMPPFLLFLRNVLRHNLNFRHSRLLPRPTLTLLRNPGIRRPRTSPRTRPLLCNPLRLVHRSIPAMLLPQNCTLLLLPSRFRHVRLLYPFQPLHPDLLLLQKHNAGGIARTQA